MEPQEQQKAERQKADNMARMAMQISECRMQNENQEVEK
jgi:hypothetical protein